MHKSEYSGMRANQLVCLHVGIIELQRFLAPSQWSKIHETKGYLRVGGGTISVRPKHLYNILERQIIALVRLQLNF